MPNGGRFQQLVRVAAAWGGAAIIGVYCLLGIVLVFYLPGETMSSELRLLLVLAITIAAVIIGSGATAVVYGRLARGVDPVPSGTVFRESISKFALLASPIAAGHGISEIARVVVAAFEPAMPMD